MNTNLIKFSFFNRKWGKISNPRFRAKKRDREKKKSMNKQKIVPTYFNIYFVCNKKGNNLYLFKCAISLSEHFSRLYVRSVESFQTSFSISLFVSIRFVQKYVFFCSFFLTEKFLLFHFRFSGSTIIQHFQNSYLNISFLKRLHLTYTHRE